MSYSQATIEAVLGTLSAGTQPPPRGRTGKLDSVDVGTPESFYMLATFCFDLSRKFEYLAKAARPFAEQIPPELASEILTDSDDIKSVLTWKDRAMIAERIMLRLHDELGDESERVLQRAADQVGR